MTSTAAREQTRDHAETLAVADTYSSIGHVMRRYRLGYPLSVATHLYYGHAFAAAKRELHLEILLPAREFRRWCEAFRANAVQTGKGPDAHTRLTATASLRSMPLVLTTFVSVPDDDTRR